MTNKPIQIAISTCPNDTFAFHGLITSKVSCDLPIKIVLLDIQQLNDGLFAGRFDVAKASFHAAALLADDTVVLPSGSALGFGVGPSPISSALRFPWRSLPNVVATPSFLLIEICPPALLRFHSWKRHRS